MSIKGIHFARIKCFSEEFTKDLDYMEVLGHLKKMLQESENDESLEKLIEDIETEYLVLSADNEVERFLTTGSKVQLHPKSKYYFVAEELWSALQTQIFKQSQEIKKESDFCQIVEDFTKIKSFYNQKILVFEAS